MTNNRNTDIYQAPCLAFYISFNFCNWHFKINTIIIPFLEMRKLRHKKVKWLTQSHATTKGENRELNQAARSQGHPRNHRICRLVFHQVCILEETLLVYDALSFEYVILFKVYLRKLTFIENYRYITIYNYINIFARQVEKKFSKLSTVITCR